MKETDPQPLPGIQPGAGTVVRLELAWGRFRRALLRRLFPGYVRAMTDRRQGACDRCPRNFLCQGDVIDPRDLKFTRNLCGYHFRPEDDRFRWRDRLGLARAGLAEILVFSALLAALQGALTGINLALGGPAWVAWALGVVVFVLWLQVVLFFRDPERPTPADADALISPADGKVTDVAVVDDPDFPGGKAFVIGIFLSVFNVHVNRAPRAGKVTGLRYLPGQFLDARHGEAPRANEQLWIDLEDAATGQKVRVKQIAGLLARRIVCWLRPGQELQAGERIGMIKFGSRTEVYLPAGVPVTPLVQVGQMVKGGATILARVGKAQPGRA